MEEVSSHFNYTEEYVLDKSVNWLNRKYKQADREAFEERRLQADNVQRGITVVMDLVFNEGKQAAKLMPSYEEVIKQMYEQNQDNKQKNAFVQTMWWKSEQK